MKAQFTRMNRKTMAAAIIFALLEAYLPLRALIVAVLTWLHFPVGVAYDVLTWLVSFVLGAALAWLLFVRWRAKFGVKVLTAAIAFVVSFAVFGYLAIDAVQQNLNESGSYSN